MKISIYVNGLSFTDGGNGKGEVTLHTMGRKLETKVQAFPGSPEGDRDPFNTLDFVSEDGGRITLYLSTEQLADVRLSIQAHELGTSLNEG